MTSSHHSLVHLVVMFDGGDDGEAQRTLSQVEALRDETVLSLLFDGQATQLSLLTLVRHCQTRNTPGQGRADVSASQP